MAEEIDDNEFFQQDFTTASEWEIFNARLEEIFHEWKLPFSEVKAPLNSNQLFMVDWEIKSETIFFADVELSVKLYRAKIVNDENENVKQDKYKKSQAHVDLMSLNNSFCINDYTTSDKIHPLAVWYGLREFVVIKPIEHAISNESQCRVLLSSACITVAESNTEIPVFVQIMQYDLNVFLGVCESPGIRINFDIIALETTPPTCKYLSGLLSMFKGKIGTAYVNPVTVSIRLTYSVSDFVNTKFCLKGKVPFSVDSDEENEEETTIMSSNFYALPYGVSVDPVKELILNCTWPEVAENVIVDSSTYSDLDPLLAPIWSIRADFKHQPIYYLTDTVSEYLKLSENTRTLASVVGSSYELGGTQNLDGGNPLDLLTESKIPNLTSVLPVTKGSDVKKSISQKSEGPLKEEELMQMLYYMFPDAQKDPIHPYENLENNNVILL